MPYIGKKPADIIATAVDTTTGTFSGDIDVDGTTNLDVVDIDGTLNVQGETTLQTHLNMGDGDIIKLGASADLQIYHDGSNSYISEQGTNDLKVLATDFQLKNADDNEFMMTAAVDGAVTLYHNNAIKLTTASTGVNVTGGIGLGGTGAANILDDYEEGTWTPTIYGTTTAGTTTYFQQAGTYTKVGRLVTVQIFLNITGQTGAGSMRLGGLPFTSGAGANTFPFFPKVGSLAMSTDYYPIFSVAANDTFCYMEQGSTGGSLLITIPVDTSFTCDAVVTYWTA
jgi:hypothetical protein